MATKKKAAPKVKVKALPKRPKRMTVKLTSTGVTVVATLDFTLNTPIKELVPKLREKWVKVHEKVNASTSKVAHAFAEVYNPDYDDDMSGDLTAALDKDGKFGYIDLSSHKPKEPTTIKEENLGKAFETAFPRAKPRPNLPLRPGKQKAKAQAKAKGKSKADEVRELIAANPKVELDGLVTMAVEQLEMPLSRAKVYVKGNIERVRS